MYCPGVHVVNGVHSRSLVDNIGLDSYCVDEQGSEVAQTASLTLFALIFSYVFPSVPEHGSACGMQFGSRPSFGWYVPLGHSTHLARPGTALDGSVAW